LCRSARAGISGGQPACRAQVGSNRTELLQSRLPVLDHLLRDHDRRRQVVAVGKAVVLEPEDVEACFVVPAGAARLNVGAADVSLAETSFSRVTSSSYSYTRQRPFCPLSPDAGHKR
jgi:hypothetical protein